MKQEMPGIEPEWLKAKAERLAPLDAELVWAHTLRTKNGLAGTDSLVVAHLICRHGFLYEELAAMPFSPLDPEYNPRWAEMHDAVHVIRGDVNMERHGE